MRYTVNYKGTNIKSEKQWLKRHNYSPLAIKALGLLTTVPIPSDKALAERLKVSLTTYKEAKRELVYSGLLEVHKLNANHTTILIGDKAITEGNTLVTSKSNSRIARLAIESLGLTDSGIDEDEVTQDLYTATDMEKLQGIVPLPSSIKPVEPL